MFLPNVLPYVPNDGNSFANLNHVVIVDNVAHVSNVANIVRCQGLALNGSLCMALQKGVHKGKITSQRE